MKININENGENYEYKYKIDSKIDGDSIQMIINTHLDELDIEGKEEKTVTVFTNA